MKTATRRAGKTEEPIVGTDTTGTEQFSVLQNIVLPLANTDAWLRDPCPDQSRL
jgi:hypothetical protein